MLYGMIQDGSEKFHMRINFT